MPLRRLLPGLLTALAAVFASAVTPAVADDSGHVLMRFETQSTFVMYNADEGAAASNNGFHVPVFVERSKGGTPARNVRVVVDASGLAGVARLGENRMCESEGPVYTCVYGDVQNGDGESYDPLLLLGVDGAEPGDSGTVTYTATADNAATITGTTRMTVGGPTLSAPGREKGVSGLAPGAPARVTARLANNTRFPAARGVALQVNVSEGLTLTPRYSNCFYAGSSPTSAWCTFPTKAAAGAAYRASGPLVYSVGIPETLTGEVTYTWSSAPSRPAGHTVRGTGAPLTLVRTAAHPDFDDSHGRVGVTTTAQADYEPVTGTVRGRVGDTVSVKLGVRRLGPANPRDDAGGFEVVPPEGTTVTSIPFTFEDTDGKWACDRPAKSGGAYVCDLNRGDVFWPGNDGTTTVEFRFRVDRQVPGAKGTIRVHNPFDRTPGNDVAAIPLKASPTPPYRKHLVLVPAVLAAVVILGGVVLYRRRRLSTTV
ncbi:hypothetical protein [Streptomyces sp. NPDC002588]|uniref:hypothetical protein n=1 Tax=Streptomyces sp. NPDC002588 TaxID=3154419 RepID=UPI00332455DA